MKNDQLVTTGVLKEELTLVRKDFKEELKETLTEALETQEKKFEGFMKKQKDEFVLEIKTIDEHAQSRISFLAESILDVREKIGVLTEMVEKNTEDIEIIKLNIELIRKDLKTKVEHKEFAALEKRVFVLEQKERKRVNC